MILMLGFISPGHSGEWRDTFDGEKLEGWTLISAGEAKDWNATWGLKDGTLNVTINLPAPVPLVADFLHWTAHRINIESLTVVGYDIHDFNVPGVSNGALCLFLGRRMGEPNFASGYHFCTGAVHEILFDKKGNRVEGRIRAGYGDRAPLTRSRLKVIFQAGRFRVFGLDVLLADFEDATFQQIDVVGLLANVGGGGKQFSGSIGTISISGPGIPDHNRDVQPQGKLATTWGQLKRF